MQIEIVRRMASLKSVPTDLIEDVAETLESELISGAASEKEIGGVRLMAEILNRMNRKNGTAKVLGSDLQRCLLAYDWPGNIRELNNLMERVYVLSTGDVLGLEDLPREMVVSDILRQTNYNKSTPQRKKSRFFFLRG
jgi:hypothetical protein